VAALAGEEDRHQVAAAEVVVAEVPGRSNFDPTDRPLATPKAAAKPDSTAFATTSIFLQPHSRVEHFRID